MTAPPAPAAPGGNAPAGAPPPAPPPAAGGATPLAAQENLAPDHSLRVFGRDVKGPGGTVVAQVVNVLVDEAGQPQAAVLDYGGFLGVGKRRLAVAWRMLHFAADGITLDLSRDQLRTFPEYKESEPSARAAIPPAEAAAPATGVAAGAPATGTPIVPPAAAPATPTPAAPALPLSSPPAASPAPPQAGGSSGGPDTARTPPSGTVPDTPIAPMQ